MKLKTVLLTATILLASTIFGQKITKKDGIYVDEEGKKYSGIYVSYYQDDVKEVVYTIKNGVEDGSVEFYYPTTEIMEQGNFKGGLKHGKWVRWSEKGNKLAEANYIKGKKDGEWLIWDERGIKRYEMNYKNGAKVGTWTMWDEKGQISNQKTY
ncbi:MAG: toxin-antitoxin system YwqK family antitoxin [Vicingaceae bacterium]